MLMFLFFHLRVALLLFFPLTATVYAKVSRSLFLTACPVPLTHCILYLVFLALFVDRRLADF